MRPLSCVRNVGTKKGTKAEDEDEEQLTPTELEDDEEGEEDEEEGPEDEGEKHDKKEPQDSPKAEDSDVEVCEELFAQEKVDVPKDQQNNPDPNQVMTLSLDLDNMEPMVESQWRLEETNTNEEGNTHDITHGKEYKNDRETAVPPDGYSPGPCFGDLDSDMEKPKCKRAKKHKREQIEQKKADKDEQAQPGSSKGTETTKKELANPSKTQAGKEEQRDEETIPQVLNLESDDDETKGTFKDGMLAAVDFATVLQSFNIFQHFARIDIRCKPI